MSEAERKTRTPFYLEAATRERLEAAAHAEGLSMSVLAERFIKAGLDALIDALVAAELEPAPRITNGITNDAADRTRLFTNAEREAAIAHLLVASMLRYLYDPRRPLLCPNCGWSSPPTEGLAFAAHLEQEVMARVDALLAAGQSVQLAR